MANPLFCRILSELLQSIKLNEFSRRKVCLYIPFSFGVSWRPLNSGIMESTTEPDTPVEALKLLPNDTRKSWLRDRGLRRLNLGIAFMFASSAGTGYNGSLINGLLVLPECKICFCKRKKKRITMTS